LLRSECREAIFKDGDMSSHQSPLCSARNLPRLWPMSFKRSIQRMSNGFRS
jgi:hypothetical protein